MRSPRAVLWALLVAFAVITAALAVRHEPWCDEARQWLVARDAPSMGALLRTMGYEGSPALWFLMLRPLAQAGLPYRSSHVLHWLLAVAAAAILLFRAPFTTLEKALLLAGYFPLFEYSSVARSYVVTMLLLWVLAATYRRRDEAPWGHGVALALLAQINTHGLLIGGVWAAVWAGGLVRRRPERLGPVLGALGLWLASTAAAVWQIRPPADLNPSVAPWHVMPLREMVWTVGGILEHVFSPHVHAPTMALYKVQLVLLVAMLALSLTLFRRQWLPWFTYVAATALLFGLFLFKFVGSIRHHGLIWVAWLACLWTAWEMIAANRSGPAPRRSRWVALVFPLLLVPGALGGLTAAHRAWTQPFSGVPAAGRFLKAQGLYGPQVLLCGYRSVITIGVLPYLPREQQMYMVELQRPGTYMVWTREWAANADLDAAEVTRRVDEAARRSPGGDAILVISGRQPVQPGPGYRLLATFPGSWRPDETAYVYRREPAPVRVDPSPPRPVQ